MEDLSESVPEILVNIPQPDEVEGTSLSKCHSGANLFFLTNVDPESEGSTPGLSPQPQSHLQGEGMLGSLLHDVASRVLVSLDNLLLTSHVDPQVVLNKKEFVQQTVDEIKWSLVKYSEYSLSTMSIDSNETDDTLSRQDTAMAFHSSMRQLDFIENQFRGLVNPGDTFQSLPASPLVGAANRHYPPRCQTVAGMEQPHGSEMQPPISQQETQAQSMPQVMDKVSEEKLAAIRVVINSDSNSEDKIMVIKSIFNSTTL